MKRLFIKGVAFLFLALSPLSLFALTQKGEEGLCTEEIIGDCYEQAVKLYKNKDLEKAKDLFEQVIHLNANYKQATDYLKKTHTEMTRAALEKQAQRKTPLEQKDEISQEKQAPADLNDLETTNWQQAILRKHRQEQKELELDTKGQKKAFMELQRQEQKELEEELRERKRAFMELQKEEEKQRDLEVQRREAALAELAREEQRQMELEAKKREETLLPLRQAEQKQRDLEAKRREQALLELQKEVQKQKALEAKRHQELFLWKPSKLESRQTKAD